LTPQGDPSGGQSSGAGRQTVRMDDREKQQRHGQAGAQSGRRTECSKLFTEVPRGYSGTG